MERRKEQKKGGRVQEGRWTDEHSLQNPAYAKLLIIIRVIGLLLRLLSLSDTFTKYVDHFSSFQGPPIA